MATYLVTFNGNGGIVQGNSTVYTSTGNFDLATVETREGYDFVGWSLEPDRNVPFTTSYMHITGDLELYAYWTPITYVVTFRNETGGIFSIVYALYGETVDPSKVSNPEKVGFDFVGWCTDTSLEKLFSFDTPITENIDVYPKFTDTILTVTFLDRLYVTQKQEVTLTYGELVQEPEAPIVLGYTYMGCYSDYDMTIPFDFETHIYTDTVVYMKMEAIRSQVRFQNEDGMDILNSLSVDYNKTCPYVEAPEKKGYTFQYWTFYGERYDFTRLITSDIILVAKYEINTYKVTFRYTDVDEVIDHVEEVTYGEVVPSYTVPELDGRTFKFWSTVQSNRDEYEYDFELPVESDMILYAVWVYDTFPVTYYRYDTKDLITETQVEWGLHVTPITDIPTKQYYSFFRWVNEDGTPFDFTQVVKGPLNLYADYSNDKTSIRFQPMGGTLIMPTQVNDEDISAEEQASYATNYACPVYLGKPFTTSTSLTHIPSVERTGYTFVGWFTDTALTEQYDFNSIIIDSIILYAKLEKNTYRVVIQCNDDNSTILRYNVLFGEKATEPTRPNKSGYAFKEWQDDAGNVFSFDYGIIRDTTINAVYIPIGTTDPAILLLSMFNTDAYFTGADINLGITGLNQCTVKDMKEASVIVSLTLENILAIYNWSTGMVFDGDKSYKLTFDDPTNTVTYVEKENVYNVPLSVNYLNAIINSLSGVSTYALTSQEIIDYLTNYSEKYPMVPE